MLLQPFRASMHMRLVKRGFSRVSRTRLLPRHHRLHRPPPDRNPRMLVRAQNRAKFTTTQSRSTSSTQVYCHPSISRTRRGVPFHLRRTMSSCCTPDCPLLRMPLRRKQILRRAGGRNSSDLEKPLTRISSISSVRMLLEGAMDPRALLPSVPSPRIPMVPPRRGSDTPRISRCCRYSIWYGRSSSCWMGWA